MAKIHFDRLEKKYSKELLTGKKYRDLMGQIIQQNSYNISERITKLNRDHWNKALGKTKTTEKRFVVPSLDKVIPADAIHLRKAAEHGKILSDELRQSLTNNLRETLNQFTPVTAEQTYIRRRGKFAGTINPKLVDQFQQKIQETFLNYTKKDPKFGVPANVREIAVTEVNATVNNIKYNYMTQMMEQNPDLKTKKRWLHYPNRSRVPRRGHGMVARKAPIPFHQRFEVPVYENKRGKMVLTGYDLMLHPHDPFAPANQVISCHCDLEIIVKRVK